jgi:hypothetical protein
MSWNKADKKRLEQNKANGKMSDSEEEDDRRSKKKAPVKKAPAKGKR